MSQIPFEQILNAVRTLTDEEFTKLREAMDKQENAARKQSELAVRAEVRVASLRDFTADRQWLADHRADYAGQWVALWYGQLIRHSTNAKEVFAAADAAGHPDALVVFVEPPLGADQAFINIG